MDGTFLVRESSSPPGNYSNQWSNQSINQSNVPDQTVHVVYKGMVKMIRVLVTEEGVGLSKENLKFKSVVETINHFRYEQHVLRL